jgi:hypothetical protein
MLARQGYVNASTGDLKDGMVGAPGKFGEIPSTEDTGEVVVMPPKRSREEDELVQNNEKIIRME